MNALAGGTNFKLWATARHMRICGTGGDVYVDPEHGQVRFGVYRCGARLCPFCATYRSARIAGDVLAVEFTMRYPVHLVLTLASRDEHPRLTFRRIVRDFALLRRSPLWRDHVAGGVYALETTLNLKTLLWHVHLHAIVDCTWFPKADLSLAWLKATGDSSITWMSAVGNRQGAANEVSKYVGKPQAVDTWPDGKLLDYAAAIRGRRMIDTFGQAYGGKAARAADGEQFTRADWSLSVPMIRQRAQTGDAAAQDALALLPDVDPALERIVMPDIYAWFGNDPSAVPDASPLEHGLAASIRRHELRRDGRLFQRGQGDGQIPHDELIAALLPLLIHLHDRPDGCRIPNQPERTPTS